MSLRADFTQPHWQQRDNGTFSAPLPRIIPFYTSCKK